MPGRLKFEQALADLDCSNCHSNRGPHRGQNCADIRLKRTSAAGAREGIFGPRSLMWRISREAAVSLAAGRALLLQLFLE